MTKTKEATMEKFIKLIQDHLSEKDWANLESLIQDGSDNDFLDTILESNPYFVEDKDE